MSMRMNRGIGLGLCWAMTVVSALGQAVAPGKHPWPSGVQGTLYGDASFTGRPAGVNAIHRLAGFQNRLFVALTDTEGHEILDVWDTRNLSHPVLLSSVDFGSVRTNGVMFTPVSLVPFREGLLLQTRQGLGLYRFQGDGRLALERTLPAPVTGLGLGLTQLHVAGRHGSLLQQVIPDGMISGQNLDQVHREVLIDLANPERPKLLWTDWRGSSVTHTAPVNGVFGGNPASVGFDPGTNRARMVVFEPARPSQHEVFWAPKLRRLFSADALDRSLKDLLGRALETVPLDALRSRGVQWYADAHGPGATLLAERMLEHHVGTRPLHEVLGRYGIALDDPLDMAISKVVGGHLDSELEAALGEAWYAAPLQAWLRTLLAPGIPLETAVEAKAEVSRIVNLEIDEQTLARYLTVHVISPLIGSPRFMEWTLGEVLDDLAGSPVGDLIDALLQTAGGFGALNAVLDSVGDLLDWLPGVDLPRLPDCARFPESTEQLIDLAMFSWNDAGRGRVLDRRGLAWFELLKFYRYLNGSTDFPEYTAEVRDRLQAMQERLGENLVGRLSEAFVLPEALTELPALHARVAGDRQASLLLGRLMAHALLEAVPVEGRFTADMSVRDALRVLGLHVREPGVRESTMADLVGALREQGLADLPLSDLYQRAAGLPVGLFASHVEQMLRLQVQASFHISDLDRSLMELLRPCLDFDVGVQDVMGDWMAGLLNDLLRDGPGMSGLLLQYRQAFENHDCIASWLVVLDAIAAATAFVGGDGVALALEYALSEGYQAGVGYLVNTLFGGLIEDVIGGHGGDASRWLAAQLVPRAWDWTVLEPSPGTAATVSGVFPWQDRVASVVQERFETNWFGPRSLKLVLCQPEDPVGTRRVYDLGRWQTVNYVNHHQGALWVGGAYFAPGDGLFPSGKALVVDVDAIEPRVQHLQGDAHLPLGSAPLLAGANHDANLAVAGLNRIYLLPNPVGGVPAGSEPDRAPRILTAPRSAEVPVGGVHRFSVRFSGTAPVTCQWFKDGVPIPGGTGPSLGLSVGDAGVSGDYSVVVRNSVGSATAMASLLVKPSTILRIVRQPEDAARFTGQNVTFDVGVEGEGAPSFQWFHRERVLAGATEARLTRTHLATPDAGEYVLEATLGEARLRSRVARLGVVEAGPPAWLKQPAVRQSLGLGVAGTLTAKAVGWGELEYAWFKDEDAIPGAAGPELSLGPVTARTAGDYSVTVLDVTGWSIGHPFAVVLTAAARMSGRLNTAGRFEVRLEDGVAGQTYSLLRSTNLIDWTEVQSGVFSGTTVVAYEEPSPAGTLPAGYFRLQVAP